MTVNICGKLAVMSLILMSNLSLAQSVQDRIKDQAQRILNGVEQSTVSESAMLEALLKLQDASHLLDISDNPGPDRRLFCKPSSSSYAFVARASDGHTFGDDVRLEDCRTIIARAANGVVCGPSSSSRASVYIIASGKQIGFDSTLEQCLSFVESSSRKVVCAPYSSSRANVARITDGKIFGVEVGNDQCSEIIANSSDQLVCAPSSSSRAYITRIATGDALGEAVSFADCYLSIRSE